MDMSATTTIGRSPEEVFGYVAELGNDVNWRSGIVDSGWRCDGSVGPGSVGYSRASRFESVWRVTTYEPTARVDWEFTEGPLKGRGGYRLEPVDGGTRFTLVADIKPFGVMRLLGPAFGWMIRRLNRNDVETLRSILEGTADSAASQSGAQPAD